MVLAKYIPHRRGPQRKIRLTLLMLLVFVALIAVPSGSGSIGFLDSIVSDKGFSLVSWEMENFLDKWRHKVVELLPWNGRSQEEKAALVREYFQLNRDISALESLLLQGKATDDKSGENLALRKEALLNRRNSIQNDVEEIIEGQVSRVLAQEGLSWKLPGIGGDGYLFPPVDFRFSESPGVLAVSPRASIELLQTRLLAPGLPLVDVEEIERRVEDGEELSALATGTGGVATYPSVISNQTSIRDTLQAVTHEWIHHYMAFFPLGFGYWADPQMTALNETIADLIGKEVGDRVYFAYYTEDEGQPRKPLNNPSLRNGFDFNAEMRKTRLRVDELLSEGKIEEAEEYMERRRRLFVEQGYHIRRLNQAYFAYYGSYGENPASISPIGDQAKTLRAQSESLKAYINKVSGVFSYSEFLDLLKEG